MATEIEFHEDFRHDCSDWPEEFGGFKATRPHQFRKGDTASVPDDAADYFKRAGIASEPGGQPVEVDKTKPVFVQPDNGSLGQKATEV